jgi:release factor H-coupled RctB family protein
MPSRALTIILNSNHSKKTVALRPYRADASPQEWILTEANNKFRTRNLSTVFLHGGAVLQPNVPIDGTVTQVWVSKGEEYVGPLAVVPARADGSRAEVRVLTGRSIIDRNAVKQLEAVAQLANVQWAAFLMRWCALTEAILGV